MRSLFISLAISLATFSAAEAQQSLAATVPPADTVMYGTADLWNNGDHWRLALNDGVIPNPRMEVYRDKNKARQFADEAAIVNFLYAQGWEVQSHTIQTSTRYHYLLKRRPDFRPRNNRP